MLLYCNPYMDVRSWKENVASVHVDVFDAIKGYEIKMSALKLNII